MMKLKKRSLKNSYNKMQNLKSVDDSTQVGCEDINMSSRRERKSLSNVFEAPKKVCEDEVVSDFEDDYYDSEVVYTEDNDKDDDWEEASFKDYQEQINLDDEEYYRRDQEEWTRAKALPSKVQIFSYNKMENKRSVDDSTQVGCEDINMSSRRERKSLTNSLSRVLERVYEDEDIESMSDFEDDHYNSNVVYNEDDYEYGWKERSFEDFQELIKDSEKYYEQDNKEWRRAKALSAKVQIFSNNTMKNKRSVDDSTQVGCEEVVEDKEEVKDEEEVKNVEEEEYTWEDHKMSFYLEEDQDYEIEAVSEWRENSNGEMIGYADIYFIHPVTRLRCKSVRDCLVGWSEPNEEVTKKWETLCQLIETLENLDEIILTANVVGLSKNVETGVGVSPAPENEEYEKAMCNECKKMDGKEYEEQTTQCRPENIEEIHISHAMCTYTVSFYAIGEQAIFEYRNNDGIQSYEVNRVDFLSWLTDEEEKKVLRFECKMREKHIKRMESKERERVRKACAWKDRDNKLKTLIKKNQAVWRRKVRAHNQRERAGVSNACA